MYSGGCFCPGTAAPEPAAWHVSVLPRTQAQALQRAAWDCRTSCVFILTTKVASVETAHCKTKDLQLWRVSLFPQRQQGIGSVDTSFVQMRLQHLVPHLLISLHYSPFLLSNAWSASYSVWVLFGQHLLQTSSALLFQATLLVLARIKNPTPSLAHTPQVFCEVQPLIQLPKNLHTYHNKTNTISNFWSIFQQKIQK